MPRFQLACAIVLAALAAAPGWVCAAAQPASRPQAATGTPEALVGQGADLVSKQQWEAARALLDRAVTLADAGGAVTTKAEALRQLGLVFQGLKDSAAARARFDRALELFASAGDRAGAGRARNSIGILAWGEGNWADVRAYFGAAAEDFAAAGERALQARSLRNITFARDMSLAEREEVLARAFGIIRTVDDPRQEGLILHQWSDTIFERGDYARAIEKLEAALPLLERAAPSHEVANALTSLGRAYRAHGLHERALATYDRVVALHQSSGDTRGLAQALDARGVALSRLGRWHETVEAEERALAVARSGANATLLRAVQVNLAEAYIRVGAHARAATLIEDALAAPLDAALEGGFRASLAAAFLGLGRLDAARREADLAVVLVTEEYPVERARTLHVRARVRERLSDPGGARNDARQALSLLEALRARAAPRDEMKERFTDQYRALFTLVVSLSARLGDAAGALEVAERARARAFLDLLAARDAALPEAAGASSATAPASVGAPASPVTTHAATPGEIVALAARLDSAVLVYWVAEDATYIWVVRADGGIAVERVAAGAERLARLVGRLEKDADVAAPLRELHTLLIAPIAPRLPATPGALLTIVPDGPLFRVSFAALRDARGRYLIESYRLHYAPSAGMLRFTGGVAAARGAAASYLLVGDPEPRPVVEGEPLAALPGARGEVRAIARLLPPGAVTTLVGAEAGEGRVRRETPGRRVVHLATHGLLADERPLESFLALARGGSEADDDGRLAAAEIYGLRIDAELVVLSACHTASGRITGDGIAGLTRAFAAAGAKSLVATLWELADESGRRLLPAFYRSWLGAGDHGGAKATALRDAQLALLGDLRRGRVRVRSPLGDVTIAEHPLLWAGIVLVGEP